MKSLVLNKDQSIGEVVFVLEGNEEEFKIIKKIFHDLLEYNYVEKARDEEDFSYYEEYRDPKNSHSRVLAINSLESTINHLVEDDGKKYLEDQYRLLYEKFNVDTKNARIYYIWDIDYKSNKISADIFKLFSNSQGNEYGDENGLLLLSYPSCEAYTLSGLAKHIHDKSINRELLIILAKLSKNQRNPLKKYNSSRGFCISKFKLKSLVNACRKMLMCMKLCEVKNFSTSELANFENVNKKIFEAQNIEHCTSGFCKILSLISIALLDLGIIDIKDN